MENEQIREIDKIVDYNQYQTKNSKSEKCHHIVNVELPINSYQRNNNEDSTKCYDGIVKIGVQENDDKHRANTHVSEYEVVILVFPEKFGKMKPKQG